MDAFRKLLDKWSSPANGDLTPAELSPEELAELDRFVENADWLLDSIRVRSNTPLANTPSEIVKTLLEDNPEAFGLSVLASFSPDGRVRQHAVRNLKSAGDRALPYLVLRSGDWVRPVREDAQRQAVSLIRKASDESLRRSLRALFVLQRMEVHSSLSDLVRGEVARRPGFYQEVFVRLPGQLVVNLIEQGVLGPSEVWLKQGMLHLDPRVVGKSIQTVLGLPQAERIEWLSLLATSKLKSARNIAVEIAAEAGMEEMLIEFLTDPHWLVRSSARLALKQRGWVEFRDHYRSLFPHPGAIAGFGEIADLRELPELVAFVGHPAPATRLEAVFALGRGGINSALPEIKARLADENGSVVKAAIKAIKSLGGGIDGEEAERLLLAADGDLQRKTRVLDLVSPWDALAVALELHFSPGVEQFLRGWIGRQRRAATRPTLPQLERIADAFGKRAEGLPENLTKGIWTEIDFWQKRG